MMSVTIAVLCFACQAIVDDYSIEDDTSIGSDGDSDGDGDGDSDSDSDGDGDPNSPVVCGKFVTPPRGDDIEFCTVKETSYFMGCDDTLENCLANELPKHQVSLSSYRLAMTETTVDAYRNFVLDRPEWAEGGTAAAQCDASYLQGWTESTPPAGTLDMPVLAVCFYAAEEFCQWLGSDYRLPTEAEWEIAARGGNDGENEREYWIYPFEGECTCGMANYLGCYHEAVAVGTLAGLSFEHFYDMAGNAWEWVNDWYRADYYCDPEDENLYLAPACNEDFTWTNPKGPATGTDKVMRGGSWYHDSTLIRTARREYLAPETSSNLAGFRCAGE
jgi:formylglycine-generating enzyme required for sulfatase activity